MGMHRIFRVRCIPVLHCWCAVGTLVVSLLACSGAVMPDKNRFGVIVRTQAPLFHAAVDRQGVRLRIAAVIINYRRTPVYAVPCGASTLLRLERQTPAGWEPAYEPVCPYVWQEPLVIAPRSDYIDEAEVRAVHGAAPDWIGSAVAGTYRAVYALHGRPPAPPGWSLLPAGERTSNPFTIEIDH